MKIHITLADLSFIGPVLIVQNNRGSIVNWNRTPTARGFQRVDRCFWKHGLAQFGRTVFNQVPVLQYNTRDCFSIQRRPPAMRPVYSEFALH